MITRVTTKGQVTIPADIRQAARIEPGAELEWAYDPAGQRLIATKPRQLADGDSIEARIARVRGTATSTMTTDEIMKMLRGDDDE